MSRPFFRLASFALALGLAMGASAQNNKAGRYFEDALKRYEAKDLEGSIVQLKNALQEDRRLLPAQILLGKASLESSSPVAAEVALIEALNLGASRTEVAPYLALALAGQGKLRSLLDDPRLQVAGLPSATQARLLLIRAAAMSDLADDRGAMASIEQARALSPATADSWTSEVAVRLRVQNYELAFAAARRALQLEPGNADALYQLGSVHHVRGDLQAAQDAYGKALALDGSHLEALVARAGIALDLARPDAAQADIAQLRKRHPLDPRADYMSALIADGRGNRAEAQASMRRVAELLAPVPVESIRYRPQFLMLGGLSHHALNEPQKAKPYLEHLLKLQPRSPASKLLAQILFDEGQVENGIQLLENYLKSVPQDAQAIAMLAAGHSAQGRQAKATQLMNQALTTHDNPALRSVLGQSLMRAGKFDAAQRELETAYKRNPKHAGTAVALVMLYLRNGQAASATPIAKALVAQRGQQASMHHLLGMTLAAQNEFTGARASFERALSLDRHLAEAQLSLARLDAREGKRASAYQRLEALHKVNEAAQDPMLELAALSLRDGKPDAAERWLEKALTVADARELRPNFAMTELLLARGKSAEAREAAKVLLGKAPNDSRVLLTYATALLAAGDTAGAKPSLVNAGRRAGDDTSLLTQIGGLQLQIGEVAAAAYTLDKALELAPKDGKALLLRASADLQLGDLKAAEQRAAQLLAQRPREATTHLLLAELAMARRQPAVALTALRRAHEVQASTATAMRLMLHSAQHDGGAGGQAVAEAWLKRHPADSVVRRELAEQLAARQQWPSAQSHYEALIKLNPADAHALNNLAQVQLRRNDLPGALANAARALKSAPNEPSVIDTHAWTLHLNGQHERALTLLRDARLRAPDNAEIRYHLAAVLAKLGRSAEARQELLAAINAPVGLESVKDAQTLLQTLK